MARTRIKFCGITRAEDAHVAAAIGVDALGFVFYPPSPRYIAPAAAARIIATLPPMVTTVGLFVNASSETVAQDVVTSGVDVVQFHGDESPADCARTGGRWIKALRVRPDTDIRAAAAAYAGASAVLLDTFDPALYGGSGKTFDWSQVPPDLPQPLILAGGLHAGNVGAAVRQLNPFAVDVSGGIEAAKGIKDTDKMHRFINEVRSSERNA